MAQSAPKLKPLPLKDPYSELRSINGWHPFKEKVPGAYVDYQARKRKGAKVLFFNFALAKEMGLIKADHPHRLNPNLIKSLIDTFALQIVNEYDMIHQTKIDAKDIKENMYMATRYLQLQHPNKSGYTSGDGRSIWNGIFTGRSATWDISSCGTGATCLSPATALTRKFYKTGDPEVSYGCGYAELLDGLSNAIFSEVMAANGIHTERTLCVLEFPKGLSINVRAGKCLLRPSHFFNHLRQNQYQRLKAAIDFFIERQINNKIFAAKKCAADPYGYLLDYISQTFAGICAQFESEYIFCWLDWDGDNILADGGIIDYGSIRQFGLYHREYRYDDDTRWSTTIPEQKNKARCIVQTFAQLVDYLKTKKKKPLACFKHVPAVTRFNQTYEFTLKKHFLRRLGFDEKQAATLLLSERAKVAKLQGVFAIFERAVSSRGFIETEDGITQDAIFCMRDILRELPQLYLEDYTPIPAEQFRDIMASSYASDQDLQLSAHKKRKIREFQNLYIDLVNTLGKTTKQGAQHILRGVSERSAVINRFERVTGDAILHVGSKLIRRRKQIDSQKLHSLIEAFVAGQILVPHKQAETDGTETTPQTEKIMHGILQIVRDLREGL